MFTKKWQIYKGHKFNLRSYRLNSRWIFAIYLDGERMTEWFEKSSEAIADFKSGIDDIVEGD